MVKALTPSTAALALGQAMLPPGSFLTGLQPPLLQKIYDELQRVDRRLPRAVDRAARLLDLMSVPHTGARFSALPQSRKQHMLERWSHSTGPASKLMSLLATLYKAHYFDQPELHDHFQVPFDKAPQTTEPEPRYMQQAIPGHKVADDADELEADVVVVGSGAAGAIVAKELAERGHAVLLVEEGKYYRRADFTGRILQASRDFYDWQLWKVALGNVMVPVPAGRTVGGSTTINTATCFRPLDWVHQRWVGQGLPELSQSAMAPYFEELEAALHIEPVPKQYRGAHVEQMSALAEARGMSHGPIRRNAPDCNGQNCCDQGCPSGGKYSMDLSYIPMALNHGAMLLTETSMTRVLIRDRRVRGVELSSGGRRFQVAAPRVVLCCGALRTPMVMWDHDLGGREVGRHLTIHPSSTVSARMPGVMRGFGELVPSSHYIDEFKASGLMLIMANLPLDIGAMPLQLVGPQLMEQMEQYDRFGNFGAMIAESGKGRMRRLPGGKTLTSYFLNETDVRRLQQGLVTICELYLDAGAEACFPSVAGWPVIRDRLELARFRAARLSASQLLLTAYHPLGTCRMGRDPRHSVVTPDHEVREVEGLSIVDGSVVPGPIGVNSQLTVMAFALRAAKILHRQLEQQNPGQ